MVTKDENVQGLIAILSFSSKLGYFDYNDKINR